jgi:ribonuclease J
MTITIHRGTHQIGGCATEICAGGKRIFIDLGSELPGPDGVTRPETLRIPGLTEGEPDCGGVFFSHTHDDHIGRLGRILPGIPIYLGETGKEIYTRLQSTLDRVPGLDRRAALARLETARTFRPAVPVRVGGIRITPFFVDHSDFDAYMFLVEADDVRVLFTGDFRLHGFRGNRLCFMLEKYVGPVDWLITEGTMLSRGDEAVLTERQLGKRAAELLRQN